MQSKDLRSLLLKLNNYLVRNLETATGMCFSRGHYEVTFEHLLSALLEEGQGDVPRILRQFGIDSGRLQAKCNRTLEELRIGNTGKPRLSPLLTDLLEQAWIASSVHHRETAIRSGTLFEVFLASELAISTGLLDDLEGINQVELRDKFYSIVAGSVEDAAVAVDALSPEEAKEIPPDGSVLDLYALNLTAQAKAGKIDPILGRDEEIFQIIEILCRRKKSNPILLGEPGVGKTAVVEGLALKVAADQVPKILKNVQIQSLDLGALQAGTQMRGEFEKRLKAVIAAVSKAPQPTILFIDEAHTLIGAGASAGGGDAANLLKPALARGEFRAIAATTYTEYNKYFAKDAALERRFQPVHIAEPEDEKAILMLRGLKTRYEGYHGIHITDDAVAAAVKLSRRFIAGRQLPDKAVDLLDTSATRVKMSLANRPFPLEKQISDSHSLSLEIESREKDADLNIGDHESILTSLKQQKENLDTEIKAAEERWNKECEFIRKLMELRKEKFSPKGCEVSDIDKKMGAVQKELTDLQGEHPQVFADVTVQIVSEVIEAWTGIPAGNMNRDEIATLLQLEETLRKRVVGQDHAVKQIADVIRGAKIGLRKDEGPIGVFLLVGPSGVGKTELARTVAEALFGEERFMVTLNMTEYQNEYNTSRLIGADPGLIGHGEGGALSEPVRRRPYCVVLLDEMEKANLAVKDLFMQVFDRGMLQDSENRHINFSNTIIFMTSNLASDVLFEKYLEGMTNPDDLLKELRPYLNDRFRPEFLGRIKPIVFLPLEDNIMTMITKMKLDRMAQRLYQNQKLAVVFDDKVVAQIVTSCKLGETGARNIDAVIDRTISPAISSKLLAFMAEGKSYVKLNVGLAEDGSFTYSFE